MYRRHEEDEPIALNVWRSRVLPHFANFTVFQMHLFRVKETVRYGKAIKVTLYRLPLLTIDRVLLPQWNYKLYRTGQTIS